MEIILKKEVPKLGDVGDIVKVKPGYARNFLIPQGIAVLATKSNRKVIEENRRQATYKEDKLIKEAEGIAAELKNTKVKLPVKVGTTGKLFGSITTLQVSRSLKELGFDIDRKDITFPEEIKEIGEHSIVVKVFKGLDVELMLDIVRDKKEESSS